jgi:hypothetical protein
VKFRKVFGGALNNGLGLQGDDNNAPFSTVLPIEQLFPFRPPLDKKNLGKISVVFFFVVI